MAPLTEMLNPVVAVTIQMSTVIRKYRLLREEADSLNPKKTAKNALNAVNNKTLHHGMSGCDVPDPYRQPIPTPSDTTNNVRYHLETGSAAKCGAARQSDTPLWDFTIDPHFCMILSCKVADLRRKEHTSIMWVIDLLARLHEFESPEGLSLNR